MISSVSRGSVYSVSRRAADFETKPRRAPSIVSSIHHCRDELWSLFIVDPLIFTDAKIRCVPKTLFEGLNGGNAVLQI